MTVFVLLKSEGRYDDKDISIVAYGADEKKVNTHAEELNNKYRAFLEKRKHFHEVIIPEWKLKHPEPVVGQYQILDIPKWIAMNGQKQVITQEMRDERARVQEMNTKAKDAAYKPLYDWYKAMEAFQLETLSNEKDFSTSEGDSVFWYVEEVKEEIV